MQCEAEECGHDLGENIFDDDPFIALGCASTSDSDAREHEVDARRTVGGRRNLRAAKQRREELKHKLFAARERRRRSRAEDSDDEFAI